MDRKNFIKSASAPLLFHSIENLKLFSSIGDPTKALPIIDTHQHLCDFEKFKVGWCNPPLPRNFSMEDYKSAVDGLNVKKSIYVEVGVAKDRRREEALYALELCKDNTNPMSGVVIAGDIWSEGFEEYISYFKSFQFIKGIRSGFRNSDDILSERVIRNINLLGDMDLSFEFSLSPKWLGNISKLGEICSNTLFIVEHCGNGDPQAFYGPWNRFLKDAENDRNIWEQGMEEISKLKNTACKISGVSTLVLDKDLDSSNLAPVIEKCLNLFGPDRVMFAGDWPWILKKIELSQWVNILKDVVKSRSFEDQSKLFFRNALKFYKIV